MGKSRNPRFAEIRNQDLTKANRKRTVDANKYAVYLTQQVVNRLNAKHLQPVWTNSRVVVSFAGSGLTKADVLEICKTGQPVYTAREFKCRTDCELCKGTPCKAGHTRTITQAGLTRALERVIAKQLFTEIQDYMLTNTRKGWTANEIVYGLLSK